MTPRPGADRRAQAVPSRARPGPTTIPRARALRGGVCALLLALAACGRHPDAEAPATHAGRDTPSGLAVPRYVATKFETVNARSGPGDDYATVWTYRARGLPLQVTAETEEWRRVCDPDGAVAWVHRRLVAESRRVMRTAPSALLMRAKPNEASRAVAALAGRATAALQTCRAGWCRITADKTSGWVPQAAVWGASDARQCR